MQLAEPRIRMNRVWAMPSADTLTIKPFRNLVKGYLHRSTVSIDPFARNCRWATYTNDLNPDTAAEYHLPAAEFLQHLLDDGVRADLVIFDPPYSVRQIEEVYQQVGKEKFTFKDYEQVGRWNAEKDLIAQLLVSGGVVLHFGWHTNGMCQERGFDIEEILMVPHGGCRNDTICTVERKRDPHPVLFT